MRKAPGRPANGRMKSATVLPFTLPWRADSRRAVARDPNACVKCGSTFVEREPAFVHCRYCGAMTRIPNASLLAQELFELRSGLRIAS